MKQSIEMTEALDQLLETLLWSTDLDEKYVITDIIKGDAEKLYTFFKDFCQANLALIVQETQSFSDIAHDFILTCNGHGAGFWDGDYNGGDKLTEACKPYGVFEPYETDQNTIGICGV